MNIATRKMNFIQEFLRISDEDLIGKLEKLLSAERQKKYKQQLKPMSIDKFMDDIEQSEEDARNGRLTDADELIRMIDKWD
jgi:hypothetical protein